MKHSIKQTAALTLALSVVFLAGLLSFDAVGAQSGFIEGGTAREQYQPLVSIPGVESGAGIVPLLNQIFLIGLSFAAFLAVLMIAIGGLQYMSSDAITGKSQGRERIQNAIIGLIIALLIVLAMNVIYGDSFRFGFTLTRTGSFATAPGSSINVAPATYTPPFNSSATAEERQRAAEKFDEERRQREEQESAPTL